jgi:AraC-like DNA-binding protein
MLEAETAEEKFRVFERVLTAQMVRQEEPDPAIAFAAHAFERGIRVRKVVARLGMLPKTFARRFENRVGLKPKEYSRVQRLQRVLRCIAQAREVDWPDFAAEHGFADQAHLIHDFREMTGLTPTAYQPRAPGEHNHVPVTSAE